MDVQTYFKECKKAYLRIEKQIIADELPHQPTWENYEDEETLEQKRRATVVYVISKHNPHMGTTAGQISIVPVKQAGELVYKDTHALASAAQIVAYHAEQKRRLKEQDDFLVKQQKFQGKGADPALIAALQEVVRGASDSKKK